MNNFRNIYPDIAIIKFNPNDDVSDGIKNRGYLIYKFYRGNSFWVLRTFRRLWFKIKLPFKSIWYDRKILKDRSNRILVFESLLDENYLAWLIKRKSDAKIAVWYWNIVKNTISPNKIKKHPCSIWSFSRKDCQQYGLNFNPPPYFKEFSYPITEVSVDIAFVGKNKGRLDQIQKWKENFVKMGFTTEFHITPNHRFDKNILYTPPISYNQSMMVSARSRAIFDYIEIDDSGQSMRVLEALFLSKKLITNNKLIKDYDFYNPKNIHIIDVDPIENLTKFIDSPYIPIENNIISRYDFDAFVRRFWTEDKECWWVQEDLK